MADFRMVVLGDSINWGQGLKNAKKFHSRVGKTLSASFSAAMLAHSGATIGVGVGTTTAPVDGEVPTSFPTILQQCASFMDSPESVNLVLVNGGINDINFRTVLNPFTDSGDLNHLIEQHCFMHMKILLHHVVTKFANPATRIVVTSYYPILSAQSEIPLVGPFLAIHGLSFTTITSLFGPNVWTKIVNNCAQFYAESSAMLQKAVDDTNEAAGGAARIFFADPGFGPANAALAPDSWLWGINLDLSPMDQVPDARRTSCNLFEPDIIRRQTCFRASAGHPNLKGAKKFAKAILDVLE